MGLITMLISMFRKKEINQQPTLNENKNVEVEEVNEEIRINSIVIEKQSEVTESKRECVVPEFMPSQTDLANGQFNRENGTFQWRITNDGCLMIYGSGELTQDVEYETNSGDGWDGHYSTTETKWPWKNLVSQIKKIIIAEGITEIGHHAFAGYSNVEAIELPNTLLEIGYNAFCETGITQIHIPKTVKFIGQYAFLKTKLPREKDEFYVDGWLITYTGKGEKRYYARSGTKGIAESAFNWCDIEEFVKDGKVYPKH